MAVIMRPIEPDYCSECNNDGTVPCFCGGDTCLCGDEEQPCPYCWAAHAERQPKPLEVL